MFSEIKLFLQDRYYEVSEDIQISIENYLQDFKFKTNKDNNGIVYDIFMSNLSGNYADVMHEYQKTIKTYLSKLLESINITNTKQSVLFNHILNTIQVEDSKFFFDTLVYTLLKIITNSNSNTSETNNYTVT